LADGLFLTKAASGPNSAVMALKGR